MANSKPDIVEITEEEEDDLEFLYQLEAAEAQALSLSSSSKRCRISSIDDSQVTLKREKIDDTVEEIEEGAYTAALKGSKSLTWKKHQELQSSKAVVKPYDSLTTAVGGGGGGGGSGGGACFRCGKEGHWARDCTQMTSSAGNVGPTAGPAAAAVGGVEKACPCGLGNCLVLTANTERNRGRQFFRCPFRQENGGCGFFEWCDISSGNYNSAEVQGERAWKNGPQQPYYQHPTNQVSAAFTNSWNDQDKCSSPTFSYGGIQKFDAAADNKGYGARTGSSCFKCGEEGHWARDCPSSSSLSDDSRGKTSSDGVRGNPSSGACFKCGQSGHWARDCSQAQQTTSRNW